MAIVAAVVGLISRVGHLVPALLVPVLLVYFGSAE
jgi:hypothetical protein